MAAGVPVASIATAPQKHDPICFSDIFFLFDNASTPGALVTGVTGAQRRAGLSWFEELPTMLGAPVLMTETPKIDLLSDLLRMVRLSGSVFFKSEYGAPFAISTGAHAIVEQLLGGKRPRNLAAFHLIAEGGCWIDCPGSGRV